MNIKSRGLFFRFINIMSMVFTPGYSWCLRCKGRWNIVEIHSTQFTNSEGTFPLCEKCWSELTPETRMPYYEQLLISQGVTVGHAKWTQVHEAVLGGG